MKICYVTGNELKFKLAKKVFSKLDIEVIQNKMETPEIQSLDSKEVAKFSAKWAANKLGIPVIKNDCAFCIKSLDNFPGALAKYTEDTIKPEGFLKLLEGLNKDCYWEEVLAYCEPGKEPVSFSSFTYGKISNNVREGRGWGYDKIFIPKGDTRTFSEMTEDEQIDCFSTNAYKELVDYIRRNN